MEMRGPSPRNKRVEKGEVEEKSIRIGKYFPSQRKDDRFEQRHWLKEVRDRESAKFQPN